MPKKKSNYLITAIGICHQKKYVGIIENNNAYLLELSNNGQVINKYFIEENIIINSIITNSGFLSLLVTKNDKYNYLFVLDEPCYCCIKKGDKCLCCVEMEKCKVIESIALIEASLSSILNAEGQKIQKVIKEENNICEILKANDSINKTIVNITMLEQILCDKLKLSLKK